MFAGYFFKTAKNDKSALEAVGNKKICTLFNHLLTCKKEQIQLLEIVRQDTAG